MNYQDVQITTYAWTESRFLLWGIYCAVTDMVKYARFHNLALQLYWEDKLVGQIVVEVKRALSLAGGAGNMTEDLGDHLAQTNQTASGGDATQFEPVVGNVVDGDLAPLTFSRINPSDTLSTPPTFAISFESIAGADQLDRNEVFLTFINALLHVAQFPAETQMQPFQSDSPSGKLYLYMQANGIGCQYGNLINALFYVPKYMMEHSAFGYRETDFIVKLSGKVACSDSTPKMTFSVHEATIADCPAFTTISLAAFKNDPIIACLTRNVPPDVLYAYQKQQYHQRLQPSSLNGCKSFKAVDDETGEIVAFARWQFPYSPSVAQEAEKEELQKATPPMPAEYNKELFNHFSSALDELQEKWVDHSKDHGLAVSPTHQRLGVGSLLLRHGLAMADEVGGARIYLESSVVAVELYRKHGFERVNDVAVDLGRYGGAGIVAGMCMMAAWIRKNETAHPNAQKPVHAIRPDDIVYLDDHPCLMADPPKISHLDSLSGEGYEDEQDEKVTVVFGMSVIDGKELDFKVYRALGLDLVTGARDAPGFSA
ncbi:MAG: hypothetical protein ASARMPRED_001193 [Alectoria sarmentosa]|nr:MAG: hypothetical protein ASARMPRED_001193 [Alectoria sarmentosa]